MGFFNQIGYQMNNVLNQASKVSIFIDIDSLITNLLLFCLLVKLFLFKGAKNVKFEKKCQITEYIDIALSDLVSLDR